MDYIESNKQQRDNDIKHISMLQDIRVGNLMTTFDATYHISSQFQDRNENKFFHMEKGKDKYLLQIEEFKITSSDPKTAKQEIEDSLKKYTNFLRHAIIARILNKKGNIISPMDIILGYDKAYIITKEITDGQSIKDMKEKESNTAKPQSTILCTENVLKIIYSLVDMMLNHLDQNGLHVRELRPEYVVVTQGTQNEFDIKLRIIPRCRLSNSDTGNSQLLNPSSYMAKEAYTDNASEKVDSFAVGALLFYMVTGKEPSGDMATIKSDLNQPTNNFPPKLCDYVAEMLHEVPGKRPSLRAIRRYITWAIRRYIPYSVLELKKNFWKKLWYHLLCYWFIWCICSVVFIAVLFIVVLFIANI